MVDVDGDGELDINELDMILKNKGVFMTQEKLEELFVKVDLDSEYKNHGFCTTNDRLCTTNDRLCTDRLICRGRDDRHGRVHYLVKK